MHENPYQSPVEMGVHDGRPEPVTLRQALWGILLFSALGGVLCIVLHHFVGWVEQ